MPGIGDHDRPEPVITMLRNTQLQKDQAIVRAFDGTRPLPPWVTYLKPYYGDPDESWYTRKARHAGDVRLALVRDEAHPLS